MQKDCFAYTNGGCAVLTEPICKNKSCPFYKNRTDFETDRRSAQKRVDRIFGKVPKLKS